jgi:hypothetical protein
MKGPPAWLVSRKDGQDERYIQLELPVVCPSSNGLRQVG